MPKSPDQRESERNDYTEQEVRAALALQAIIELVRAATVPIQILLRALRNDEGPTIIDRAEDQYYENEDSRDQ